MSTNRKPVILLAFTNPSANPLDYLPNEYHALTDSLADAESHGWCEVVDLPYATVDRILDKFQSRKYRNRIAIFHYAGHANAYQFLLEKANGKPEVADAGGLARFLSQQTGLELVFLNGCSTYGHAQGLLDAGVSAVIVTSLPVNDEKASEFAERFYKGLAGGATLKNAFDEAQPITGQVIPDGHRTLGPADEQTALHDRWIWRTRTDAVTEELLARQTSMHPKLRGPGANAHYHSMAMDEGVRVGGDVHGTVALGEGIIGGEVGRYGYE